MATTIKLKNSVTATNAPSSLVQGEVAINVTDKKVWVGNAATTPIQLLGGGADGSFTNISVSSVATFGAGAVGTPSITTTGDTNTGIFFPAADTIAFTEGGVESMRIDSSGNVGIGTSSPTAKLYVNANNATATQILQDETNGAKLRCITNSINVDFGNSGGGGYLAVSGAYPLTFSTNSSERMRIDSSGNVGIGTSSPKSVGNYTFVTTNATTGSGYTTYVNGTEASNFYANSSATVIQEVRALPLVFETNATERMRITSAGAVGIGTSSPAFPLDVRAATSIISAVSTTGTNSAYMFVSNTGGDFYLGRDNSTGGIFGTGTGYSAVLYSAGAYPMAFFTNATERMRITSGGDVFIGRTSDTDVAGISLVKDGFIRVNRDSAACMIINRNVDDGDLVVFRQASATEGSISVSGSTVSYNGGHLSRWSQWQNQTGKPEVYRGSVLESTNDMCEWNQDNEQATKTIISSTVKSKAVAGVFDMYDTDDKDNPYDFYVAQSGDFVIRIAQGVVVENGDLLESAGDGTARPQTDDICRSSTVAKVTSNYVSTTYADGSYCVPCILMIG
jgi:hypothetical protein